MTASPEGWVESVGWVERSETQHWTLASQDNSLCCLFELSAEAWDYRLVIPAKAGIQENPLPHWILAFAGMAQW
jgi:hypothetical protein